MSIQTQVASRQIYDGNGLTTAFATVFRFFEDTTLLVTLRTGSSPNFVYTMQQLNVDYTVSGGRTGPGDPEEGTVEFTVAPPFASKVIFERLEPFTQLNSYDRNGPVPGQIIGQQDDRLTFASQQISDLLTRVPVVPQDREVAAGAPALPASVDGKILVGLPDGAGWINGDVQSSGVIVTPVSVSNGGTGATTAPQARANLGLEIGVDVNEFMATVTAAEAEAGTSSTRKAWTPITVKSAIENLGATVADMRLAFLQIAELQGQLVNMKDGVADSYDVDTNIDAGASSDYLYFASGGYIENSVEALSTLDAKVGTNVQQINSTFRWCGVGFTPIGTWWPRRVKVDIDTISGLTANDALRVLIYESAVTPGLTSVIIPISGGGGIFEGDFITSPSITSANNYLVHCQTQQFWTGTLSTVTKPGQGINWSAVTDNSNTLINAVSDINMDVGEDLRIGLFLTTQMVLESITFTADFVPTRGRVLVQVQEDESITANTDLIAEISRDGGTTWTAAVLGSSHSLGAGTVMYEDNDVDLTAQPSGSAMRYRVRTPTNKRVKIHGTVLQWA